jgi:hypothetical protein
VQRSKRGIIKMDMNPAKSDMETYVLINRDEATVVGYRVALHEEGRS